MSNVLIFGGLSRLGKTVIEQLLGDGDEVIAVRPLSDDRNQEEEIEMFFGRHAFFHAVDNEWTEVSQDVESVICLDCTTFFSPDDTFVDAETVTERVKNCFDICSNLNTILVASHIDIYGRQTGEINERTPVSPDTTKGRHVDEVERGVIEALLQNKEKARTIRLTICRLPDLYTSSGLKMNESMIVDDVAKGICALLQADSAPGIEVVQLTSGKELLTEQGMVKYSFEKAKELINFSPREDV